MAISDRKYWAFISYSHSDAQWADWLHKGLERYRIPRRLVGAQGAKGEIPPKLFPVFLDRDELAGSAELGPELQSALREARHLIVICSPNSARSHWVNEEIKYFKSLGKADRVLALIVDGEPHAGDERECFPRALQFHVDQAGELTEQPAEPIAADVRPNKDGKQRALLKLTAGVLGVAYDDLAQREAQARLRRMAVLTGMASVVAIVTAILAIFALQARDDARRRQAQAEDLIEFMLGDLRERLEPIGRLDVLDPVGNKAMEYFATLDQADQTDQMISSRAKALRQIGDVRLKQGRVDGAVESISEAVALYLELADRHPRDADNWFSLGHAAYQLADAYLQRANWEEAEVWAQRQLEWMTRAAAIEPHVERWQVERGDALGTLGSIAYYRNELSKARDYFLADAEIQRALTAAHVNDVTYIQSLVQIEGWLSSIEIKRRNWTAGLEHATAEKELLDRIVSLEPDNAQHKYRLLLAMQKVLFSRVRIRPVMPNEPEMLEADRLSAELAQLDPENVQFVSAKASVANYRADAYLVMAGFEDAEPFVSLSLNIWRNLVVKAPDVPWVLDGLLKSLRRMALLKLIQGQTAEAQRLVDEGVALINADAPLTKEIQLSILLAKWRIDEPHGLEDAFKERVRQGMQGLKSVQARDEPVLRFEYAALTGDEIGAQNWFERLSVMEQRHPFVTSLCAGPMACSLAMSEEVAPTEMPTKSGKMVP